ncbi:hypothetical protein G7Y89_g1813 [Cudoniella acicularis]|uniref:Ribosomal protein S12 n=1 Tax=Cudoniella acicularis TaxID=354080 RepID=A0A8H4RVM1_9HELO|nr:hypothetical protein G7Y89_g1813 [Cudoniella acicularis]
MMATSVLRRFLMPSVRMPISASATKTVLGPQSIRRNFSATPTSFATYNQVAKGCRGSQRARKAVSPALRDVNAPELKGVCLKVGITSPKKPNSGQRKTARVRLRGRSQDCPGVRYHLVRGAMDLGGVGNRVTSRSKYGTKKPKKAAA